MALGARDVDRRKRSFSLSLHTNNRKTIYRVKVLNMIVEYDEKQYEFIRVSDVIHDGMSLELYEVSGNNREQILHAFWSDTDGRFTFHALREALPFEIVEDFVQKARQLLPPITNGASDD